MTDHKMIKSNFLKCLAYLVVASATVEAWQYNLGIRFIAHDIFGVLFIITFVMYLLLNNMSIVKIIAPIRYFLLLLIGFYAIKLISFAGLLNYGFKHAEFLDGALSQFLLGIVYELFTLSLFACFAIYFCQISQSSRHKIVMVFVFGIVASCIYQYLSLYMMVGSGIDLDAIVWPAISYGLPTNFTTLSSGIIGSSFSVFYRAGGFSLNPNGFSAQLITIIPFLILYALHKNRIYAVLVLGTIISLALTLSRSGILAMGIALMILFIIEFKIIYKRFKIPIIMVSLILFILGFYYGEGLFQILIQRVEGGEGLRANLNQIAIEILSESPFFGTGYNTSSVALLNYGEVSNTTGINLHNFWSIKVVELGALGLAYYSLFHVFILASAARRSNIYSKALFCTLLGLSISGFFNNAMASFPIQLFILTLYCTSGLYLKQPLKDESKKENFL